MTAAITGSTKPSSTTASASATTTTSASASIKEKEKQMPWVEKYRPKSMDQVSSQDDIISVLRPSLTSDNLPHLLFYGPPGTGKTSTILALARDLFGPQLYKSRILELNASDERGISVIRDKVKLFAKSTARETVPGYPCPPFKLIILDEADSLTTDAQTALRRTMELYSKGTRFCLICNYVSRIIEPLTSRCAKFRFKPVQESAGLEKLKEICQLEGVRVLDGSLEMVLECAKGDLRRAITLLQSAHSLDRVIDSNLVCEMAGVVPFDLVSKAYQLISSTGTAQQEVISFCSYITDQGYSVQQFCNQLSLILIADPTLDPLKKSIVSIYLSHLDSAITDGADELLQLLSFMLKSHQIIANVDATNAIINAFIKT